MEQSKIQEHANMFFASNMIGISESTELELAQLVLLRSQYARDYLKCKESSRQQVIMEHAEAVNSQIKKLLLIP